MSLEDFPPASPGGNDTYETFIIDDENRLRRFCHCGLYDFDVDFVTFRSEVREIIKQKNGFRILMRLTAGETPVSRKDVLIKQNLATSFF